MNTEITWAEAWLMAIRSSPETYPNYCQRCGVEDDRSEDEHDAEFHVRYCASCGEREGSDYASHCCQDENMLEETEGGEE